MKTVYVTEKRNTSLTELIDSVESVLAEGHSVKIIGRGVRHYIPFLKNGEVYITSKMHSLGGGEWSQEFYGYPDCGCRKLDNHNNLDFLGEVVGENGTRCSEEEHQDSMYYMQCVEEYLMRLPYQWNLEEELAYLF
jgi:hypothetical protein